MKVDSILVPTDFSATSDAALHYATQMALTLGARLYLMHVPGKTGEHIETSFPFAQFETAAREQLASFLTPEELARLRPEYALRVGTPAEEIVRYAETCEAGLIIMGTHGRTGLAHMVIGSVAEHVARTAPCPVLLFRTHKRAVVSQGAAVKVAPARTTLGLKPTT